MTFSHLSISPLSSEELISFYQLNSVEKTEKANTVSVEANPSHEGRFIPVFLESDQIFLKFYEEKICDLEGNPLSDFNLSEFPKVYFETLYVQNCLNKIEAFISKKQFLDTMVFDDNRKLNILFSIKDSLKYLLQLNSQPHFISEFNENQKNKHGPIPIQDIQLIGSSVFHFLGVEPILYATQRFFRNHIQRNLIESWFQMDHVKRVFNKDFHDGDIRIFNEGSLSYQAYLSNSFLSYLASSTLCFDPLYYIEKLQKHHQMYQSLDTKHYDEKKIKEFSVKEFGGLIKRKIVDLPETQYAVMAVKQLNEKPVDFLFVGTEKNKPAIKNLNLSSLNCLTISLYNLLINDGKKDEWYLKIECRPFSAAKAMIDLLCGISTIGDPNVDAWLRFLRDCDRSKQPDIEYQMVQNTLKHKAEFFNNESKAKCGPITPLKSEQGSDGEYIFYLLKEEFNLSQTALPSNHINSSTVVFILFRACMSLQQHSDFTNEDCAILWNLAFDNGCLQVETKKVIENQIAIAIKTAILDEKVPFEILSAWMGMMAWIWTDKRASDHCQKPVFYLNLPFTCLLPLQPIQNGQTLIKYLNQHHCPHSFRMIWDMMSFCYKSSANSSCLIPYFDRLQINLHQLQNITDYFLVHPSPFINKVGLQLLSQFSPLLFNARSLNFIFYRLPKLLHGTTHLRTFQRIHKPLMHLASQASSAYQEALKKVKRQPSLTDHAWISNLIQTNDPELLLIAYHLWRVCEHRSKQFVQNHYELGWSLYSGLCIPSPNLALALLPSLSGPHLRKIHQIQLDSIIRLIQAYQSRSASEFACDLDRILPHIYSLFEAETPIEFKNKESQTQFSNVIIFTITTLHQQPFKDTVGDYFLLEASRHKYLDFQKQSEIWFTRLDQLLSNPEVIEYSLLLFNIITSENLVASSSKNHLVSLKIKISENLFRKKQIPRSLAIFDQISKHDIDELDSNEQKPFYPLVFALFEEQCRHPFEESQLKLLTTLLMSTPPQHRVKSQALFLQFFQRILKSCKENTLDISTLPLNRFDEFLSCSELIPFINHSNEKWKKLLLNYLIATMRLETNVRLSKLWEILKQIEKIFNKNQDDNSEDEILRFCKTLSFLFECSSSSSQPPNVHFIDKLNNKYEQILYCLHKNECLKEAKAILFALNKYQKSNQSPSKYIWWVCQHELRNSQPSSALKVLDLDTCERLSPHVSVADYPCVPTLINELLSATPIRASEALQWTKWCLRKPENEKSFNRETMNKALLACSAQFIVLKDYNTALDILSSLSNLTAEQEDLASSQWTQIASKLYQSASVALSQKLFIENQYKNVRKGAEQQLQPLAGIVIQRHLSESSPSLPTKELVLGLLKKYSSDATCWLAFWKILNIKQDPQLVSQTWKTFRKKASSLTGSKLDLAQCWTSALHFLYEMNNFEILDFFNTFDWLNIFSDPLTSQLKLEALEPVFLGAIRKINPKAVDPLFFKLFIEKKDSFIKTFPQERQVKELKEWNRKIELALLKQLSRSSDYDSLCAVSEILRSNLSANAHDPNRSESYLSEFKQVAASYVELNPNPSETKDKDQDLSKVINQTVDIICQTNEISTSLVPPLVKIFLQNPTRPNLEIARKLTSKVLNEDRVSFNEGKSKEIDELKPSFLTLIPLVIELRVGALDQVETLLTSSFIKMSLTLGEKCNLSHLFLMATFETQESNPCLEEQAIDKQIKYFTTWASYLFAKQECVQKALKSIFTCISPYIRPQTNSSPETNTRVQSEQADSMTQTDGLIDIEKYYACLEKILEVKFQTTIQSIKLYQGNQKQYHAWVIREILSQALSPGHIINLLSIYTSKIIRRTKAKKATFESMHQLMHLFVTLYPPQEIEFEKNPISGKSVLKVTAFETKCKALLQQAFEAELYKDNPDELLELELTSNLAFQNVSLEAITKKKHRPILSKVIDRFLIYQTPAGIYRSIQMCYFLQNTLLTKEQSYLLFPVIEKILRALRPHLTYIIQLADEDDCEPLFHYLLRQTLDQLPTTNLNERKVVCELSQLYYEFILEESKKLLEKEEGVIYSAIYIVQCFKLLETMSTQGAFQKDSSEQRKMLKGLIPIIKEIEYKYPFHLQERERSVDLLPQEIVGQWVQNLMMRGINLKTLEIKERRKLAFEFLDVLQERRTEDNLPIISDCLLYALIYMTDKSNPISQELLNETQRDAVLLMENIRKFFQTCDTQSLNCLNFELIYNQFHVSRIQSDYPTYLTQVRSMIAIIPTPRSLNENEFTFIKLSRGLLIAILQPHYKNRMYLFVEKREIYILYLEKMLPILKKMIQYSNSEAEKLLLEIIREGIVHNLLTEEYRDSLTQYSSAIKILSDPRMISYEQEELMVQSKILLPAIKLFDLYIYRQTKYDRSCVAYQGEIESLIPSLSHFVVTRKDYPISKLYIQLITMLPVVRSFQFQIFLKWMLSFYSVSHPEGNQKETYDHLRNIACELKAQGIFDSVGFDIDYCAEEIENENSILNQSSIFTLIKEVFISSPQINKEK